MCVDPGTMLAAGATLASTALSVAGKASQYADNSALYIDNGTQANVALANTYNATQAKAIQEGDKAATEAFDVLRGLTEAKGQSAAAAGEAGVEGVSFANVLSDHEAREGRARGNIDANYQMALGQVQSEQEAARNRARGQINSVARPSETGLYAGIGADLFKGGLKIYDAFTSEKDETKLKAGRAP